MSSELLMRVCGGLGVGQVRFGRGADSGALIGGPGRIACYRVVWKYICRTGVLRERRGKRGQWASMAFCRAEETECCGLMSLMGIDWWG